MRKAWRAAVAAAAVVAMAACGGDSPRESPVDRGPLVDSTPAAEGDGAQPPMTADTPTQAGSMGGTGATAGDDSQGAPSDSAALHTTAPPP